VTVQPHGRKKLVEVGCSAAVQCAEAALATSEETDSLSHAKYTIPDEPDFDLVGGSDEETESEGEGGSSSDSDVDSAMEEDVAAAKAKAKGKSGKKSAKEKKRRKSETEKGKGKGKEDGATKKRKRDEEREGEDATKSKKRARAKTKATAGPSDREDAAEEPQSPPQRELTFEQRRAANIARNKEALAEIDRQWLLKHPEYAAEMRPADAGKPKAKQQRKPKAPATGALRRSGRLTGGETDGGKDRRCKAKSIS
jgi:hypothetical protein